MLRCLIFLFCLLCCSLLTGCFSPETLPQENLYTLSASTVSVIHKSKTKKTLLVMETQANNDIDTKKMAYVNKPYQLAYFTKNAWAATPAEQLTTLITQALQRCNHFKAVVATPFVGTTTLKLNTHLFKLQQNFLFKPSRLQLVLSAQLVMDSNGKVIAEKTFSYNVKTQQQNPYGGVVAANQAVQQLLRSLTRFVLQNS